MAAACPLCSLRLITCVPPLTRDSSKSEVTKPLGLPVRLSVSPPLLTLHCALPTRQTGLPHVAVSGRLTLASSPWGPAENVLAAAGSAVGEECYEAPRLEGLSSFHRSLTTAWSWAETSPRLTSSPEPAPWESRGNRKHSLPACTLLSTCGSLSPGPDSCRREVLHPFHT